MRTEFEQIAELRIQVSNLQSAKQELVAALEECESIIRDMESQHRCQFGAGVKARELIAKHGGTK